MGAAYSVHNSLGLGLLENVYEGAMVIELQHRGLKVERQVRYPVSYHGEPVGDYFADLVGGRENHIGAEGCEGTYRCDGGPAYQLSSTVGDSGGLFDELSGLSGGISSESCRIAQEGAGTLSTS